VTSAWRKQALGTWLDTWDPQYCGTFDADAERAQQVTAAASARHRRPVTLYHLVLKAVATAVTRFPEVNHTLRFGRAVPHAGIPLACLTYVRGSEPGAAELQKYVLADLHRKSLGEIARADLAAQLRIHRGRDPVRERRRRLLRALPAPTTHFALRALDFLSCKCGLGLGFLGFPAEIQGAGIVNNLTQFNIEGLSACIMPSSRAPFLLSVTAVQPRPVPRDGRIEIRPVLRIFATFDHRLVDGYTACLFGDGIRRLIEDPEVLAETSPPTAGAGDRP